MTKKRHDAVFPTTFGADITVSDIDLETDEFVVGGRRLTESHAAEIADRLERRGGRPSLTAPGTRSPVLNLRVSQDTKEQVEHLASRLGRRPSDIVREALAEYLERHNSRAS